ncbi:MAG: hypothetical protein ACT4P1_17305 [Sporichthyaceae bacterium]
MATTVKVSEPTRDRINALGAATAQTADQVVGAALDEYERALFFDDYRKAVDKEAKRGLDPEVAVEVTLWDRTLRDGLTDA